MIVLHSERLGVAGHIAPFFVFPFISTGHQKARYEWTKHTRFLFSML